MTRCLSQHVDAGCCEPVDLKVVTVGLSPQTSRTSSMSWTQDDGIEVTQLPSTTLASPVQVSIGVEDDNAISRSSWSRSPSNVSSVSSVNIAHHSILSVDTYVSLLQNEYGLVNYSQQQYSRDYRGLKLKCCGDRGRRCIFGTQSSL